MSRGANPYYAQLYDREFVTQRYVTERKSPQEIAAEVGSSDVAVRNALRSFEIPRRSASETRDLTFEDVAAWKAKGGSLDNHPIGPKEHKAAAEELGYSSVDDLIVLSRGKDPFYAGTPTQVTNAEWFKEQWEGHGATGHLRRLHYRLVGGEERVTFADGKPYVNNLDCFGNLCMIAGIARALNKDMAAEFTDRRNPDPVINIEPRSWEPEPDIEIGEPGWLLPSLPTYSLTVGSLRVPEPSVAGYDYDPADQPFLIENWVEKSTVNDVLDPLCRELDVNLVTASGNQSITRAVEFLQRCRKYGKPGIALYISDCDKAGGHMPTAVARQLEFHRDRDYPDVEVVLIPIALTEEQVEFYKLPRSIDDDKNGPVELDALEALHPGELARIVREAVAQYRDPDIARELGFAEGTARSVTSRKPGPRRPQNCALSWPSWPPTPRRPPSRSAPGWTSCAPSSTRRSPPCASARRNSRTSWRTCGTTSTPSCRSDPRPSRRRSPTTCSSTLAATGLTSLSATARGAER